MVTLRDYQVQAVRNVRRGWANGQHHLLGVMATGGGKTHVFLQTLIEELEAHPGRRALILAHRIELITQPLERLEQFWPEWGMRAGIVMAETNQCDKQIVVATVQTLASPSGARVAELLAHGPIDYLVTDEAHHATASTYVALYKRLLEANPHLKHLGVTATPMRADGAGLVEVYDDVAFKYGIAELVKARWLVPPRWLAIQTGISLAGVAVRNGDFAAKQLANVYETQNCFDLVVESHQKHADGRQCLAFVETVDGAYRLAETFQRAGVRAEAADGTTRKDEREAILRRFRAAKTQVLCNVGLWTEGLDVPQVSCIHQVRPTKSDGLYMQMVGRGLRPVPGKEDCIAEGQRVLTDHGLVPIELVTRAMRVWDGVAFVAHEGVVPRGEQEVITYAGLTATPDHRVWTRDGWRRFAECARQGLSITITELSGAPVREADGYQRRTPTPQWAHLPAGPLHNLRGGRVATHEQPARENCWLPQVWTGCGQGTGGPPRAQVALSAGTGGAAAVHEPQRCELCLVRGEGHRVPLQVSSGHGSLGGGESGPASRNGDRSHRQQRALRAWQPAVFHASTECGQQQKGQGQRQVPCLPSQVSGGEVCGRDPSSSPAGGPDAGADQGAILPSIVQAKRRVWDILNAGLRHRFTVEGLLVSNCLILDYAPVEWRNIVMLGDVLGIEVRKDAYIKDAAEEDGDVIGGFTFDGNVKWLQGDPAELISRELDYLELSPFSWHRGDDNWLTLGLGEARDGLARTLVIVPQENGDSDLWVVREARGERGRTYTISREGRGDFDAVSDAADELIGLYGNATLAARDRRWRKDPASEAQERFARRLGVWKDGMRKGECAQAITHKLACREIATWMRTHDERQMVLAMEA